MLKFVFTLICGFILGAVVIENKQHFSDVIPIPVALFPDGGEFEGGLLKGRLNGTGRIVWPNGDLYEGEFKQGLFHGFGRLHKSGFVYDGEFDEGIATGFGKLSFLDGRVYEGDIEFGLASGNGVMTSDKAEYSGAFEANQYEGRGQLILANGDTYEGEFQAGLYHGEGLLTKANGEIYSGTFVDGLLDGEGEYRNDQVRYSGEFKRGEFSGNGEYEEEGGRYQGEFLDGVFHGSGTYTANNGLVYRGDFDRGLYHGQGILEYNGDRYEGGFEQGLEHGDGVLIFAKPLDGIERVTGKWFYGNLVESDNPLVEHDSQVIAEDVLYQQADRVDTLLSTIEEQDPKFIELYFVGIAGDGSQGVFRREMDYIQSSFDRYYATEGKSAALINSNVTYKETPLATITSVERVLKGVASKMDEENDILFIFFSSHGSKDFSFQLYQQGLSLPSLTAEKMGEIIKSLPVKHKVVVVSSCYAGGYIQPVKDENTMVIVASAADKASFGCSDRAEMTYFGEAFFKDALPQSDSFVSAFEKARDIIKGREAKEGFENSNPLIFKPKAIRDHLVKWRTDLALWKRQQNKLLN